VKSFRDKEKEFNMSVQNNQLQLKLTRREALQKAISILSAQRIDYSEEVQLLSDILEELPLKHWTDKSIHDSVQDFIKRSNRLPNVSDFGRFPFPPHTVISNLYGITVKSWLEIYYPTYKPTQEERKITYTEAFKTEYLKIKPTSARDYNKRRNKECVSWNTISSYYGNATWLELIAILDLPLPLKHSAKQTKKSSRNQISLNIKYIPKPKEENKPAIQIYQKIDSENQLHQTNQSNNTFKISTKIG